MQTLRLSGLAVACATLVFAGCASDVKLDTPAPVETRTPAPTMPADTPPPAPTPMPTASSDLSSSELAKSVAALNASTRIVYFDYDSYVVKDAYRPVVEAWGKRLSAEKNLKATVEGHTDERGGSEYNLALGQKRAEAVVKSLTLIGAADSQLEAVSYGKERPAVTGSDEAAWSKNRRAELTAK